MLSIGTFVIPSASSQKIHLGMWNLDEKKYFCDFGHVYIFCVLYVRVFHSDQDGSQIYYKVMISFPRYSILVRKVRGFPA